MLCFHTLFLIEALHVLNQLEIVAHIEMLEILILMLVLLCANRSYFVAFLSKYAMQPGFLPLFLHFVGFLILFLVLHLTVGDFWHASVDKKLACNFNTRPEQN